jgi:hypothetical protein
MSSYLAQRLWLALVTYVTVFYTRRVTRRYCPEPYDWPVWAYQLALVIRSRTMRLRSR